MTILTLAPTSALEAINRMLATIGEAPVNSLNTNGLGDVALALAALQEAAREVQERGWNFNTDERVNLPLDVNGYIWVPTNALRIKPEADQQIRVAVRGNPPQLWDKDHNTFVWTSSTLLFRIVYMFDFESLPDVFRRYIAIKAGRIFQEQLVSSQMLEKYTAQDEYEALALVQDYDTDTQECNMIYNSPSSALMMTRSEFEWIW
ncbi:MAG: hypothetical protein KGI54_08330 [Pseudomonadota bacterium]|nr:hypothetical protein [Pseudomonadota bacterium]